VDVLDFVHEIDFLANVKKLVEKLSEGLVLVARLVLHRESMKLMSQMAKRFSITVSLESTMLENRRLQNSDVQSYRNLNSSLEELEKSELLVFANSCIVENACTNVKDKEHHVICGCQWRSIFVAEFLGNQAGNVGFFNSVAVGGVSVIP